jgi:hypothetical protein
VSFWRQAIMSSTIPRQCPRLATWTGSLRSLRRTTAAQFQVCRAKTSPKVYAVLGYGDRTRSYGHRAKHRQEAYALRVDHGCWRIKVKNLPHRITALPRAQDQILFAGCECDTG